MTSNHAGHEHSQNLYSSCML